MAGLINLQPIDQPDVDQTEFGPDMKRWLANMTDVINENFNALTNALAITSADIGGGGVGPIAVTVIGLVPGGTVTVNLLSSSNTASIASVVVGTGQFTVTFSADPGASAIIQYAAFAVGLGV